MDFVSASNYSFAWANNKIPEIGQDDLFNFLVVNANFIAYWPIWPPWILHLYGWKFPCDSMAWRLIFILGEYVCMTHPLDIHIWKKIDIGRSRLVMWPSWSVCPISLSLVWKLGNLKPVLDSLALYILSNFNPKWNGKKCWNPAENSDFCGHS